MDYLISCALFIFSILKSFLTNPMSKSLGNAVSNSINDKRSCVIPSKPNDCRVVLKDIMFENDAEKLRLLNGCLENNHMTHSNFIGDKNYFKNLGKKNIECPKMNDNQRETLDNNVHRR